MLSNRIQAIADKLSTIANNVREKETAKANTKKKTTKFITKTQMKQLWSIAGTLHALAMTQVQVPSSTTQHGGQNQADASMLANAFSYSSKDLLSSTPPTDSQHIYQNGSGQLTQTNPFSAGNASTMSVTAGLGDVTNTVYPAMGGGCGPEWAKKRRSVARN